MFVLMLAVVWSAQVTLTMSQRINRIRMLYACLIFSMREWMYSGCKR